jgi:4-amino-4-deoxy-L-arabinose transferase-like glycosyltransferase
MTEPRHFSLLDFVLVVGVVILALVLRAGYLRLCTDAEHPQGTLFVQDLPASATTAPESEEFKTLVENVKFNYGFIAKAPFASKEEVTADRAPGYPVLVGLLARVVSQDDLYFAVQWIQVLVSSLTAGLCFLFARRAFRSTLVALVAGVLTAIYPLWIINTAAINDGTLAAFLLAMSLWLGVRAGQSGGPFSSLLFGLFLAGLALTRAYCFPFTVAALAWFLIHSRHLPWGWLCALVAFLGFVIGLAPWTVRNYQVFGEPVPIADSGFYHVWIGNNPKADGGPVTAEMEKDAESKLNQGAPKKLGESDQPERYSRLHEVVREMMHHDTLRVVNARFYAALYFFLGKKFFDEDHVFVAQLAEPAKTSTEDEAAGSWARDFQAWLRNAINVVVAVTILLLLAFGLLGWRWTYGWRRDSRPATLAMLFIPLPYILTHAEALHGPRMPLDGILLCYAAFVLCLPFIGGYLAAGSAVRGEVP